METGELVRDEVWRRLDPHAGRLSRRQSRRVTACFAALVVIAFGGVWAWMAGVFVPRFGPAELTGWDTAPGAFHVSVMLANAGERPIALAGVGRDGPGLVLDGVDYLEPVIPGHAGFAVRLNYRVTDCAAVPTGDWPVPVRVRTWYGDTTVDLRPDSITLADGTREWQAALAHLACGG